MTSNKLAANPIKSRPAVSSNIIKLFLGKFRSTTIASLFIVFAYLLSGAALSRNNAVAVEIEGSSEEQTAMETSDSLMANRNLMSRLGISNRSRDGYFVDRVVELTNKERAKYGLKPVKLNLVLNQVALRHSQDMAMQDFFDHIGLDGSEPWDRMSRGGYQYSVAAENIAAGFLTPETVVKAWMDSPGHRANILAPDVEEIGIGYYFLGSDRGKVNYKHYWTQVFGTPPMYSADR
ncbi:MAG: CAP domain-containing protein [Cyanobacteriota bacterium]|nr:CAP domain-containing protein [Cyanobacteriota bacterium]